MPRAKKPNYEYVDRDQKYRKRIKDAAGKYVAIYGKTESELTDKLIEFCEQREEEVSDMENPLVNDYAQRWLSLNCGGISQATKKSYQSILNNRIKPYMEGLHMKDVRPNDIKAITTRVAQCSESVHNTTFMLLKRIFTTAFENGDIPNNPCPVMHNGGVPPQEKKALTADQVTVLLDAVRETRAYLFCMIGLYAGLRVEEILGLKWSCVHLEGTPKIEVRWAVRHARNKAVVSETLKSDAAKRVIPIPDILVDALKEAKANCTSEFVFFNTTNGPLSYIQYKHLWHAVVCRTTQERTYYKYVDGKKIRYTVKPQVGKKANCRNYYYTIDFRVTPHILRHTYITNLILSGADIKSVQYLAGHEKAKTTLDIYSHLTYNRPEETSKKVNAAFSDY